MISSSIPTEIRLPFAANASPGYIEVIPVASQIGVVGGKASFNDGFPPLTFLPQAAGGIPPFGEDMNGVLNIITQWIQWGNAGGSTGYNSTFSSAIGGYPKGAVLANASLNGFWQSTTENNTTDPDTGGAGWIAIPTSASVAAAIAVETTRAETEEAALQTEITAANTAIAAETARAEAEEAYLQSEINTIIGEGSIYLTTADFIIGDGYVKIPGGLIIEWATATSNSDGEASVTFPLQFPNGVFGYPVATVYGNSHITYGIQVIDVNVTGAVFNGSANNIGTTITFGYIVFGH